MPQALNGVLVLIASPGDAVEERASVSAGLNDWNITRGRREAVALLPWLWERHSVARVGGRPQGIINAQAVDKSDVVIAFFDSRLGTATGEDVSGTAEEINRAVDQGKHVHVYFSEEPLPRDVDPAQLQALNEFKAGLEARGVMGRYSDPADLVGQVVRAIEADIDESGWAVNAARPTGPSGADLRWRHAHEREQQGVDKNGKTKYRTTRNDLIVTNESDIDAIDLTFEVAGIGGADFIFEGPEEPVTVYGRSTMAWLLIPTHGPGSTASISARWTEGDAPKERKWTVALEG